MADDVAFAMSPSPLRADSWPHKLAIACLDALLICESVAMLSRSTNPFFGGHDMTAPTSALIAFMLLQLSFLGAALLLCGGTCVRKVTFVRANGVCFVLNALNYAVYAAIFALQHDDDLNRKYIRVCLALAAALAAVLGALLCHAYTKLLLRHATFGEQLPTESPSFAHRKLKG